MNEEHRHEPYSTDKKADGICGAPMSETCQYYSPQNGGDTLYGKQYAVPVACILVLRGGRVQ